MTRRVLHVIYIYMPNITASTYTCIDILHVYIYYYHYTILIILLIANILVYYYIGCVTNHSHTQYGNQYTDIRYRKSLLYRSDTTDD